MTESLVALIFVLALLLALRRRGCGVNDLSRWKQYGGTLERPGPPGRSCT
jgi:hypothetical protein